MQNPIRTMALGLLLACAAMSADAKSRPAKPLPPASPAAVQPSSLDLTLPPPATQATPPAIQPDLGLPSATQSALLDPGLHSPVTPPSPALRAPVASPSGISSVARPMRATPPSPLEPATRPASTVPSGPPDALQSASAEVRSVARWVVDSRDNAGMPFLLIDKVNAQVYAFNPAGLLQGAAPALLGMAHGDRMLVPNDTEMSAMPPQVRITPAGRFVSSLAIDSHGKELLVLDYAASFSLHAVVKGTPAEHRAERLNSPSVEDNRISFGCINVPTTFYSSVVSPAFTGRKGIVYVLPETAPASQLFGFQPAGAPVVSAGALQGSGGLQGSAGWQGSAGMNARSAPAAPSAGAGAGQARLAQ